MIKKIRFQTAVLIILDPPCTNRRGDCVEYGRQACEAPYGRWASTYCAAYCGLCGEG